jgi:hypothetical protein
MLVKSALSLAGVFGTLAALLIGSRQRRRTVAQQRTWPGRKEIEQMDSATLNEFLASRGLDVRVVDDAQEAEAV